MSAGNPGDIKPWDQRKDESVRYYAWFLAYADLPPAERTVAAAYRATHPTARNANTLFWEAHTRFEWPARAAARDFDTRRRAEEAKDEARREEIARFRESLKKKLEGTDTILTSLQLKLATITQKLKPDDIEVDLKNLAGALGAYDRALRTWTELQASTLGLDDLAQLADKIARTTPEPEGNAERTGDEG